MSDAPAPLPLSHALINKLMGARPDLQRFLESEEGMKALSVALRDNSAQALAEAGVPMLDVEDVDFLFYALQHKTYLHEGILTPEAWAVLASFEGARAFEFIKEWDKWVNEEAMRIFRRDYEVKQISEYTAGRWAAFGEVWAELTLDARKTVFDEYLTQAVADLDTPLEWQLQFATGMWSAADVDVPYVDSQREAGEDEKAVPTGAKGQEVKM